MNGPQAESVAMGERAEGVDRRKSSLTEDDFARIGETFDHRLSNLFEVIGYDTSTPDSRAEIRDDHKFVRDARKAKGTILGAIYVAIGSGIASLLYFGAKAVGKAP